jgi:Antitoxin Xre/MbcA/ParS C-terminal toxin-binding domain
LPFPRLERTTTAAGVPAKREKVQCWTIYQKTPILDFQELPVRMHMATVAGAKDRHRNAGQVGLRTFFAIAEKWRLTPDEAMTLLGKPGKGTYYNWKNGQVGQIARSHDLQSRISYVLGIFKALEILYQRPEMADAWVRKPNKAFGGQSALDRMLGGQMIDLAAVRDYLDSVRGGW